MFDIVLVFLVEKFESVLHEQGFGLVHGHQLAQVDTTVRYCHSDQLVYDFIDHRLGPLICHLLNAADLRMALLRGLGLLRCLLHHFDSLL